MKRFKSILLSLVIILVVAFGVACNTPSTPAPKVYDVYFETFGYSDVITQEVTENECAVRPSPDPESDTHNFIGWYTDMSFTTEFDFTTPITQDIDIYAKWIEKESTYTINFDKNGHGKAPAKQFIEAGTNGKITKPNDLSANGWKFLGWSLDKDGADNLIDFETFIPSSSITLYAQWKQLVAVNFDLNNEEALIAPPTTQLVEIGQLAIKPEDPVIYGFRFEGWYTDKEFTQAFDFDSVISERTTLYAKWIDNTVGYIDGSDLPAYEWEKNAAYGERPDLEGYLIDGEIGEKEAWASQTYYVQSVTDAPSVRMEVTTIFSEKGLYVFGTAKDNGGVYWTGINYHFKNTSWTFYVMGENVTSYNVFEVPKVEIDTRNVFPSWVNVRGASKVVDGEINTTSYNKYAQFNVEFFMTWQDLRIDTSNGIPEKVYIYPSYNYKRLESANFTYNLVPTFSSTSSSISQKLDHFLEFNADGFVNNVDSDSILGDSDYGIAMSRGWNVENNEATSTAKGDRVVFFKGVSGSYYQFSTELTVTGEVQTGNAGITIFNSENNYTSLRFDINDLTYKQGEGFVIIRPKIFTTNKDGVLERTVLDDIAVTDGRIVIKTVFSNGYVFYIVNGKLINCQLVTTLNVRTVPGLMSYNVAGVKFINNSAQVLDESSAAELTSQFAYVISKGKTDSLTMTFNTVGVSNEADNELIMYYQNSRISLTNSQKERIVQNNDFTGVRVNQIESITATTNGTANDITDDFRQNAGYGQYVMRGITGDTHFTSTSSLVDTDQLIYKQFNVHDIYTKNKIPVIATAVIKSSNPTLGYYDILINSANAVLVLVKGYDYEIRIDAIGYRSYYLEKEENVTESEQMETIYMTPNIVGGTATDEEGEMMFGSSPGNWDMTTESLGYVDMETTSTAFSSVYFSGVTVDEYQVMEICVANTINVGLNSTYEANPGAGFMFVDSKNSYSWIELAGSRLRILHTNKGWNPTYINIPGSKGTVNILPADPDDPSTYVYTKLTVIKIYSMCYVYVNDEFVTAVELFNLTGKCGVALSGHSSYYLSLRYKEYWIKVGNEALTYAKERVGMTPVMDEYCYDVNEDYEADYTKPYIKIDGLTTVNIGDAEEQIAFTGQKITVSLTEYALKYEGISYVVSIGDKKAALTATSPSFEITISADMKGNVPVKISQMLSYTVSGKVEKDDGSAVGSVSCIATSDDGEFVLRFTTGEDGTFIASLPSDVFSIKAEIEGYACKDLFIKVNKDITDYVITAYKAPIGGGVPGGTQKSGAGLSLGYDYDDGTTQITGLYGKVDTTRDVQYAFNEGFMHDFVIEYSYVRKEVVGDTNETNPAVGIAVYTNGTKEALTFYTGAVRIIPAGGTWADRINVPGRGNYNLQNYNEQTDFKIMRRKNVYYMYYKHPSETEYHLTYVYESLGEEGASEVFLQNTCANTNSFLVFNIKVTRFDDDSVPSDTIREITVNNTTPELGSYYLSGGTVTNNGTVYAMGDRVTVNFVPNDGYSVSYVKVDGKLVSFENNKSSFVLGNSNVTVECGFKVAPVPVTVKGKVIKDGVAITESCSVEFINLLGVVVKTLTTKADGTFETVINSGNYVVRPVLSGCACENKQINLTENVEDIVLNCGTLPFGGDDANSDETYGYNFSDEKLTINGAYLNVKANNNVNYAFTDTFTDFVFDFSHVRREVAGVTNETNPSVGLIINTNGVNEHVSYYSNAIRIIPAGKQWADRINVTNLNLPHSVQKYDYQIDFRIIRKNNVIYFYYKSPTETDYKFAYKYTSQQVAGESSLKLWYSTSYVVDFYIFNVNAREIGTNEFTNLP